MLTLVATAVLYRISCVMRSRCSRLAMDPLAFMECCSCRCQLWLSLCTCGMHVLLLLLLGFEFVSLESGLIVFALVLFFAKLPYFKFHFNRSEIR